MTFQTPGHQKGKSRTFTFAALTAAFLRLTVDSSGYAAICTASQKAIGVSETGVAAADPGALCFTHMHGSVVMKASGAIAAGGRVYAADDGKVAATGSVFEGMLLGAAATADGDLVEVLPVPMLPYLDSATVAASTAVANTITETSFGQTYSLAIGTLEVGDVIEIEAQGIATTTNSTDTLNVKLYLGSTELAATGALDVANSDIFVIRVRLVVRTIGASGTFVLSGTTAIGASGTITEKAVFKASTAVDTTVANAIDVKATWSVAHASNSCRMDILRVKRVFGAAA